jgi:hypothetical protein
MENYKNASANSQEAVNLDLFEAMGRRDDGMRRTAQKADRLKPGAQDEAVEYVRRYAKDHLEFLTEHVRAFAALHGYVAHDGRAWGPVVTRASKLGICAADGFAAAASSNGSPKVKWRSLLYGVDVQRAELPEPLRFPAKNLS